MVANNAPVKLILMGGLGNQLFQLAFGVYISTVTGKSVTLQDSNRSIRRTSAGLPEAMLYTTGFILEKHKSGILEHLVGRGLGLLLRLSLNSNSLKRTLITPIKWCLSVLASVYYQSFTTVFAASDIGFTVWYPSRFSQVVIGYFQSHKYLNHPEVLKVMKSLVPKSGESEVESYRDLSKEESPLLVHIRLGDYRNEPKIGVLSPAYYHNAINEHMESHLYNRIWVFSDEISQYKSYIPEQYHQKVRLIESVGSNSVSLLEVMRMCKGYVIANSSLSWWAASLSFSDSPQVTYPEPWFEGMATPRDLINPGWKAVPRK